MNREQFAIWVAEVQKEIKINEFCKKVYCFTDDQQCKNVSRNTIGNWKKGLSCPKDIETILSIALIEYDKVHVNSLDDCIQRNERYVSVNNTLRKIAGVDLYCRNLRQALLVQVSRGIISFPEVLEFEKDLESNVNDLKHSLSSQEKRDYALVRATERIESSWYRILSKEEIVQIVKENGIYFYTGNRTLGERLNDIYNKRLKMVNGIPLEEVVEILAPNYRNSIKNRIYNRQGMSREWLIDFCLHLRFDRSEIQEILKNAHMVPLSDDESDCEYYIREWHGNNVGSAQWYQEIENMLFQDNLTLNQQYFPHYKAFEGYSLIDKLQMVIAILLCTENYAPDDLPPIDYILESFSFYDVGKDCLTRFDHLMDNIDLEQADQIELQSSLEDCFKGWKEYIQCGSNSIEGSCPEKVYVTYRKETSQYYNFPNSGSKLRKVKNQDSAIRLRYVAALMFTILTGEYYKGILENNILENLKSKYIGELKDNRYIFNFLSTILIVFLSDISIEEDEEGAFYCQLPNSKKKTKLECSEILDNLWESVLYMKSN